MHTELLDPPALSPKLVESAPQFLEAARRLNIGSAPDSAAAQTARAQINAEIKRLTAVRMGQTKPLDESKKKIMAFFATPLSLLEEALGLYGQKIIAYNEIEAERARKVQAKLDAESAKERARLQAISEAARAKGQEDKAEAFENRAAAVVAPIIRTEAPKVAGTQFREVWKHEVTDPTKINAPFMEPSDVKIGQVVRSMKQDAVSVVGPGLRVWAEKIIASGRG